METQKGEEMYSSTHLWTRRCVGLGIQHTPPLCPQYRFGTHFRGDIVEIRTFSEEQSRVRPLPFLVFRTTDLLPLSKSLYLPRYPSLQRSRNTLENK